MHSFSNGLVRSVLIATCGVMIYAHGSWTLDLSKPAEFFSWEGYVGLPLSSCAQPRLGGVSSRQLHAALSKTDATPAERFSEDPGNHSANSRANLSGSRADSCRKFT